jgi:hypothetical protein
MRGNRRRAVPHTPITSTKRMTIWMRRGRKWTMITNIWEMWGVNWRRVGKRWGNCRRSSAAFGKRNHLWTLKIRSSRVNYCRQGQSHTKRRTIAMTTRLLFQSCRLHLLDHQSNRISHTTKRISITILPHMMINIRARITTITIMTTIRATIIMRELRPTTELMSRPLMILMIF